MKNRVRAIIIKDKQILLIKRIKADLIYFVIPGGGVEESESNESALIRECLEELGVDIEIKELFSICLSEKIETFGQREYFYLVDIKGGILGSGDGEEFKNNYSDKFGDYYIEWHNLSNLAAMDLKPLSIKNLIIKKFILEN